MRVGQLSKGMHMQQAIAYFNALNRDYLTVHQGKEECFWQLYMGIGDDSAAQKFSVAESAYKRFIAEPRRLKELRTYIAVLESQTKTELTLQGEALLHRLYGWYRFFDCNVIEDPQAQALMDEIIAADKCTLYAAEKL